MTEDQLSVRFVQHPGQLRDTAEPPVEATTVVGYHSAGHLLIIGPVETSLNVVARLDLPRMTVVEIDATRQGVRRQITDRGIQVFSVPGLALLGYLGAFVAYVEGTGEPGDLARAAGADKGAFDLVLDLSEEPLFAVPLPPLGYAHVPSLELPDSDALLAELQALVGEFEKPRYFAYDTTICAHARRAIAGCERCQTVCATGAISGAGDGVVVDPYLCQGCGSCATVCPTGAMTYAYPKPADAIAESRRQLAATGARSVLLHAAVHESAVAELSLPASVLALTVEEVTAFGIDYWSALLCAGVGQIVLLLDPQNPAKPAIDEQIALLCELLDGLGIHARPVLTIAPGELRRWSDTPTGPDEPFVDSPHRFATFNDKRQTVRLAFDALARQHLPPRPARSLPEGAPFGRIQVDTEACTLCMGCVSICPAGALLDGQDSPALRHIEANCVQCGLCASACPESAITLQPRYLYDSVAARKTVQLHAEAAFNCILCNKPFATLSMIERMSSRLAGHWMFGDEKARRRLKMCKDCRVKDLFADDAGGIDVHREHP